MGVTSEIWEEKVEALEKELRGTQEMLFLVLEAVVEPVYVDARRVKDGIKGDKIIDITLDENAGEWVFSVKDVGSEQ